MKIIVTCPICTKMATVEVPDDGYAKWQAGAFIQDAIQDAMPDVPTDTREQLLTGIDPKCWDEMWKETEE